MKAYSKHEREAIAELVEKIEMAMELTTDPEVYTLLSEALDAARKVDSTERAKLFRFITIKHFRK